MAAFEFSPIAESLKLELKCPVCGCNFVTDALEVPSPNFLAETHAESTEYELYTELCPQCERPFDISIFNGFGGGIRRAITNFGGFKKANSQIRNKAELIIYKDEKFVMLIRLRRAIWG